MRTYWDTAALLVGTTLCTDQWDSRETFEVAHWCRGRWWSHIHYDDDDDGDDYDDDDTDDDGYVDEYDDEYDDSNDDDSDDDSDDDDDEW